MKVANERIKLLYIDLFCGFGGTTQGIENALDADGYQIAKVIACVNHDPIAINSHYQNHIGVIHFTEDIRKLAMRRLRRVVEAARLKYPNAKVVLWASLECTEFSIAKGGKKKKADSRTLAFHLFRYIDCIDPDYIQIENVREFRWWGPLYKSGKNEGKPIKKKKGTFYFRWINKIQDYRYKNRYIFKERILNAADYGAYTARKRLFICFSKPGLPNLYPAATHSKNPKEDEFGKLKKWNAVREVLDLELEGKSIFDRKKPLVENTLKRILAGLTKYGAGGDLTFISKYFSGNPDNMVTDVDKPCGAITTKDHHSLVFMNKYYGKSNCESLDNPTGALTTKDRNSLIQAKFMDVQYSGKDNHRSIDRPCGTITQNNKFNLVHCDHFLYNPQWTSKGGSVDDPAFTLIARMDKAPPSIISIQKGRVAIKVHEDDSITMKKIKAFMAYYGIIDIKMRMLNIPELLRITGLPEDYKTVGNETQTKKMIGNAVVPIIPQRWVEAICAELEIYSDYSSIKAA